MIPDSFQRLGREQDVEILLLAGAAWRRQMSLKQSMAQAIYFGIRFQNALRVRQVASEKALMDLLQHLAEQGRHLYQLPRIRSWQLFPPRFQLHYSARRQVADSLEIGDEL